MEDVEIEGTEPYIVGGHTASGYWVDTQRATTLPGLFAAGDVAGGGPQKFVTGCFAEGEIAALASLKYIEGKEHQKPTEAEIQEALGTIQRFLTNQSPLYGVDQLEEAMQKVMDDYAGGISTGYIFNVSKLQVAKERIEELLLLSQNLRANSLHELMQIFELIDRLYVCKVLIRHLETRNETRWHSFQENADYPEQDDVNWLKYVNSRFVEGQVEMILRDLVKKDEVYEHSDR